MPVLGWHFHAPSSEALTLLLYPNSALPGEHIVQEMRDHHPFERFFGAVSKPAMG
jgi:hypothetical protein